MKISFQTVCAAPISNFSHTNCRLNPPLRSNLNDKYDTFVKSNLSFGSVDKNNVRDHVVDFAVEHITSLMIPQAMLHASAHHRKLPNSSDFDGAMRRCFDTMSTARWSYGGDVAKPIFPSEDEFVVILQNLWNNSNKNKGADSEEMYKNVDVRKLHYPSEIKAASEPFIKADFGRAMAKFSKDNYSIEIKNENDVEKMARKLYNDENVFHFKDDFWKDVDGRHTEILERMSPGEQISYYSSSAVLKRGPSLRKLFKDQQAELEKSLEGASYDDGDFSEADKYGTVF